MDENEDIKALILLGEGMKRDRDSLIELYKQRKEIEQSIQKLSLKQNEDFQKLMDLSLHFVGFSRESLFHYFEE